jgi:hypothetical protein
MRAFLRADDGIRTRDPHLGKVMLYQLSHVRVWYGISPVPGSYRVAEAIVFGPFERTTGFEPATLTLAR